MCVCVCVCIYCLYLILFYIIGVIYVRDSMRSPDASSTRVILYKIICILSFFLTPPPTRNSDSFWSPYNNINKWIVVPGLTWDKISYVMKSFCRRTPRRTQRVKTVSETPDRNTSVYDIILYAT